LQAWETEIFARVTQVFGVPQKPSNASGQGQVTLLYSAARGRAPSGLAGYFFSIDLYPDSVTFPQLGIHSNERDILYVDPNSSDTFLKGTMAHEFQHMINYSQHVFQFGGPMEVTWINEGLSMAAMDVAGYGYQVGNNTAHAASFMTSPGSVSLWTWQNSLADYGAAWLFFRYAADRFGNQILGRLVQTSLTGAANVESQTGQPMGRALREEALTILPIPAQLGLSVRFPHTSTAARHPASPLILPRPGSVTTNIGAYPFYRSPPDPSLPAARITIQAGTATPWIGFW